MTGSSASAVLHFCGEGKTSKLIWLGESVFRLGSTGKEQIISQLSISASALIPAPADQTYAVLADYRKGHPAILPQKNLYDLQVEAGGYGAGTIIRFRSKILGSERSFHQVVSEPEPGRVIVEKDIEGTVSTTFTVTPVGTGEQALVNITTRLELEPGLQGVVTRLLLPSAMKRIYEKELRQLVSYVLNRA